MVCTFFRTYGSLAMNSDLSEAIGFPGKIDSNISRSWFVFKECACSSPSTG